MRKVVIFCMLIVMLGVISAVSVTGECGESCPQECIDNGATCTYNVDSSCDSIANSQFLACRSSGGDEQTCSAIATQFSKKPSCTYDEGATCYDTDGGVKELWYGETTNTDGTKVDFCKTLGYHFDDKKHYWLWDQYETGYCKTGEFLWGGAGYVDRCSVREYSCSGSTIIETLVTCNSGICYNGRCACESTADCGGSGYRCEPDPDGKGNFCKKISCNETDVSNEYPDGKDPYTFGIVVSEINSPAPGTGDLCKDSDTVQEFFCLFGQNTAQYIDCPEDYACLNGECVSVDCGNGFLEGDEECDDGNLIDNDGCSSSCIVEYCRDYTTKTSCFDFTFENCTWTPPETGTAGEGGGCCPKETPIWSGVSCLEPDPTGICTIPWLESFANELRTGAKTKNDIYGSNGAVYEFDEQYKYCAKVTNELNYGLWYDIEVY